MSVGRKCSAHTSRKLCSGQSTHMARAIIAVEKVGACVGHDGSRGDNKVEIAVTVVISQRNRVR